MAVTGRRCSQCQALGQQRDHQEKMLACCKELVAARVRVHTEHPRALAEEESSTTQVTGVRAYGFTGLANEAGPALPCRSDPKL